MMNDKSIQLGNSPIYTNNQGNTSIVLNGTNNFSSLRIEDPKKGNLENDICFKIMMNNVPQVNEYFTIIEKIGEGTFSKVYRARLKKKSFGQVEVDDSEEYALKYILPIVKPSRIAKELRFLRDLGGLFHIIPIKTCFYNNGHTVIVMPLVEHEKFVDYIQLMNIEEIRNYMRNLLVALDRVHVHGIIHRDIKPSNFLYNRSTGQCALVDFGLSQNERELYHFTNMSLFNSNKSNDSKVRTNLSRKFNASNNEEKKLKRSLNDMNNNNEDFKIKRVKTEESSVFTTPITPSMESSVSKEILEDILSNISRQNSFSKFLNLKTPIKNSHIYKTPTKNNILIDANKTPVKSTITVPETPPKTVQKNLHFSRLTPSTPTPNKENVHMYSTPKMIPKPTFQRFQMAKKVLHPELSALINNNTNVGNSKSSINEQNRINFCECVFSSNICRQCLSKYELNVPRAGTPGFRAPEILLRCQNQSTKIDIWSCGVIFASLLSGRYPFFRCADDMTCLAEIITLLGSSKVKRAAAALGKTVVISQKLKPTMNLKDICIKLKQSSMNSSSESNVEIHQAPDSAYNLLKHLLDPNPFTRYSANEALNHPFFTEVFSFGYDHS